MLPSIDAGFARVPTYFLMVLSAALAAWILGSIFLKKIKIPAFKIYPALIACTAGAVIGARVLSVLSNPQTYDPLYPVIFKTVLLYTGGFSIYGAIVGGILLVLPVLFILRIPALRFMDNILPVVYIALGIGRIGCLCTGCCWGKPTLFPIALEFHDFEAQARPIGVPLHATQIYEMAAAFLFSIVLLYILFKIKPKNGIVFVLSLLFYPTARFLLDELRGGRRLFFLNISFMQWVSLFLILSGIIVTFRN